MLKKYTLYENLKEKSFSFILFDKFYLEDELQIHPNFPKRSIPEKFLKAT